MSNMKDLLGDMTLEEFEVKRKKVLGRLTNSISLEEFEVEGMNCDDRRELYRMWLELYGNELTREYIEQFGSVDLTWEQIHTGSQLLVNGFISWLKSYE